MNFIVQLIQGTESNPFVEMIILLASQKPDEQYDGCVTSHAFFSFFTIVILCNENSSVGIQTVAITNVKKLIKCVSSEKLAQVKNIAEF